MDWTSGEVTFPAGDASAVRDVLDERGRQVSELGYTPEHDMQHTPKQLLEFSGGSFGNPSREQIVRLAACALAAIARIDAGNETVE